MKRGNRRGGVAAVVAAVVVLMLSAADWPTFLADNQRSAASTGTTLSPANAGQLANLWNFKTGGVVAASPTVVGGVVYVGSWDGNEYALDAATGALRWQTALGTTNAPGCSPPSAGISSAATVQGGVVYVGGGDAYWYALDATTGSVVWKVFTGDNSPSGGHYNWSSPLIYNGFAYIGVASLADCPLVQGQLLKVDLSTHQVVSTWNAVPNGHVGGGIWTSPALDAVTNTIYVTTGTIANPTDPYPQAIVALDASTLTLKDFWQLPANQAVNDSDWGNTPTLFNDTAGRMLVEAINKNGYAYAWNRANLAAGPVWQTQVAVGGICPTCGDGSVSSGAFAGGTLFLAGGNGSINNAGFPGVVRALDPATGNFKWQHGSPAVVVPALAYVNGLVIDGAGPWLEVLNAADGTRLYSYRTGGTLYAAPSVAGGEIFTGGVDGRVYAFGLTTPGSPPPDPNCPSGWTCQDVGSPSPSGSESASGSAWTVNAGGAGVGGNTDSFRFIAAAATGDTQITADVTSITANPGSSSAGLMVRQTADSGSPYYEMFLTPANGVTVQYRTSFNGATTKANTVAVATPRYLELVRNGDVMQAATSTDGQNFTLVPGTNATVPLPAPALYGVAVSSGNNGTLTSATLTAPVLGPPGTPPATAPPASPCPGGWSCAGIGNPKTVGDQSLGGSTFTVKGAGSDINGYGDQFHFVWQTLNGDGNAIARVLSQTNTSGNAKAGVMLRQSAGTGSTYYAAFLTPGHGVQVQYRLNNGLRTSALNVSGAAPVFLKVSRVGNTFTAYTSADGVTWTVIAGSAVSLSLTPNLLAGLAVTSANTGNLSAVTFDTVSIGIAAPPPPSCPVTWTCADIGGAALTGGQSLSSGTWTINGGGGDIWSASDQFHFVWQGFAGDETISAHVTSQTNTSSWAKAGVMLRATADAASPYYAAFVTPGNGVTVQYRSAQGGTTTKIANPAGTVPVYLQIADSAGSFTAYTSADGLTWSPIAGSTVSLSLGTSALAGLAVTSHNVNAVSTASMDTVTLSNSAPPPPPPPSCIGQWSCADIGGPAPAGSQSLSNGVWTLQGAGSDIYGTADQFHFVWQSLPADGSISAHVTAQTNTNAWAKAGVMLRVSTDPSAANYAVYITPGNGVSVQYRASQGATTKKVATATGTVPIYLKVTRAGTTFSAYTSADGVTWTLVPGSTVTLSITGTLLEGLAVTSHHGGTLCTVNMDGVQTG